MEKENLKLRKIFETTVFFAILLFIIINGIINEEYYVAVISAVCGITYSALAGKGTPLCYLFGLCGSLFYATLSLQNSLWGNLLLYVLYYIPMQILGFFQWRKNLKEGRDEIIKTKLTNRQRISIFLVSLVLIVVLALVMGYFKDSHPILDSITTTLSVVGMYLTVKRALEQWIAWMVVNLLSCIMWLNIALSGEKVFSTAIMWGAYLLIAVYFFILWKKEIQEEPKRQ